MRNADSRRLKIRQLDNKYKAEVEQLRADIAMQQQLLNADMEVWAADIQYFEQQKFSELNTFQASRQEEINKTKI